MADLFNKNLLDININLYIRILASTNMGLTNSKQFSQEQSNSFYFRTLQKVV